MKILIAEDDFTTRLILQAILSPYGECDLAVNGDEAIQAFRLALEEKKPYDLVCLDIMMPEVDGHEALKGIREIEKEIGIKDSEEVKVVMITALDDPKNVVKAFYKEGATSYMVKPIEKEKVLEELKKLGLIGK